MNSLQLFPTDTAGNTHGIKEVNHRPVMQDFRAAMAAPIVRNKRKYKTGRWPCCRSKEPRQQKQNAGNSSSSYKRRKLATKKKRRASHLMSRACRLQTPASR